MVISLRKLSRYLRMLVFVGLFSFICYKVLAIVHVMIEPTNKYKQPVGSEAVKVDADYMQNHETIWQEMRDRLSVFYQIGE